eukprot:TRINITY_DN33983_c0_g1_i1.p1 TRINITY_DN33983_c0_g1~~TRINITY_DN33983_c0_g1_i1.p1  ORF type:complete len:270 (+),score=49.05 TRINITY_DN33983_c0_g1_i1:31-810(+)
MTMRTLQVVNLGRKGYREVLKTQEDIFEKRKAGIVGDTVLVVEHSPSVVTVGNREQGREDILDGSIDVVKIKRGGRATWHGAGQLTMYPIVNFKELEKLGGGRGKGGLVHWWVSCLEKTILNFLQAHNVQGWTCDDVGVWVGGPVNPTPTTPFNPLLEKIPEADRISALHGSQRKIAAIGVQLSRYCSMHGIAININPDLNEFKAIVPCGLSTPVTALAHELPTPDLSLTASDCIPQLISSFVSSLGTLEPIDVTIGTL